MENEIFDIIERITKGDKRAYAEIVNEYKDIVYTACLRMIKDPRDAEEVAQDTFVKAFQAIKTFDGRSKFSTWLYKIAWNTAISKIRKKVPENVSIDLYENQIFDAGLMEGAIEQLTRMDRERIVNEIINNLSEFDSFLITLYYFDGQSVNEIAKITDMTQSNIKIRLYRARKNILEGLQAILKDEARSLL